MGRIGTINYATNTGLGLLVKSFFDNGILDEILIVEHTVTTTYEAWYPEQKRKNIKSIDHWDKNWLSYKDIKDLLKNKRELLKKEKNARLYGARYLLPEPIRQDVNQFLDKIDILFLFETPFYYEIIDLARSKNIKVALMPMYECTPYPTEADIYICPSLLDLEYYKKMYPKTPSVFIPVPAPKLEWKKRERAEVFIHNAGRGGTLERNGTIKILNAIEHIRQPAKIKIRMQKEAYETEKIKNILETINDDRLEVFIGNMKYEELFTEGDVFLFPESFNGLSLPLQEAFSSGMGVMCGERFPMTTWLPREIMIPVDHIIRGKIVNVPFKYSRYNEKEIAALIDKWYGQDIEKFSIAGKKWSENNSWETLKPKYLQLLHG